MHSERAGQVEDVAALGCGRRAFSKTYGVRSLFGVDDPESAEEACEDEHCVENAIRAFRHVAPILEQAEPVETDVSALSDREVIALPCTCPSPIGTITSESARAVLPGRGMFGNPCRLMGGNKKCVACHLAWLESSVF